MEMQCFLFKNHEEFQVSDKCGDWVTAQVAPHEAGSDRGPSLSA